MEDIPQATGGWIFDDDEDKPVPTRETEWPVDIEPYLLMGSQEQWDDYSNMEAYEFEKRLRKFIETFKGNADKKGKSRRFTYQQVYQRLFGEEVRYGLSGHQHRTNRRILAYYSSRVITDTNIKGHRHRRVYVLSPTRLSQRPWGLRLRLEWFVANGVEVTPGRMRRAGERQLEAGHARNPRTEANMEARREKFRELYRARYNTPEYRAHLKELHEGREQE